MKTLMTFLLIFTTLFAFEPSIKLEKNYGISGNDYGMYIGKTIDGGYIISVLQGEAGIEDTRIIKTNFNGEVQWSQTYGGIMMDIIYKIIPLQDTSYYCIGTTHSFDEHYINNLWLLKLNSIGDTLWTKCFGGEYRDNAYDAVLSGDNDIIITGSTQSYSNGGDDVWLLKYDKNGNQIWNKNFGSSKDEEARSICKVTDGGFILSGINGNNDIWAIRFNDKGDSLWTYSSGKLIRTELGKSIKEVSDGFIIGGGAIDFGDDLIIYLNKIDFNGNEMWHREYGETGVNRSCHDIGLMPDGGYLITGKGKNGVLIFRTDHQGNIKWEKSYGNNNSNCGRSIYIEENGESVVCGELDNDTFLLKLSQDIAISINCDSIDTFLGDTIVFPIYVHLPSGKHYDSAQLTFYGYQNGLEFIKIDSSQSMTGNAGWSYALNEIGDSLIISWIAGSENISGNGVLFNIQFKAIGDICSFYPLNIQKAIFNTGEDSVLVTNGGIYIQPIPVYGDVDENGTIQAHDAALVLKHLVEIDTLFCQGLANADVTDEGSVSALDASVILQYGVGLLSDLPYDTSVHGSLLATGEFSMEEEIGTLGGLFEVPIFIENGSNIYSFEGCLEYDPEFLIFSEIRLSLDKSGYQIQVINNNGQIRWASAGTNPDGNNGTFIVACFRYNPLATYSNTTVYLTKIRVNEEDAYSNVGQTLVYNLVGIADQNKLQNEFSLSQNYPNPFNPTTTILYQLPKQSFVKFSIYDISGRLVETLVNEHKNAGYYSVNWNADNVVSGIYIYKINAGEFTSVKRCLVIK